ncbi:PREDICTED: HERV-H LTR-associating protein 2, partial [Elephantulus edwardii]|uniref:HERV-H LTR-associating protein 2 n=1 Tax=Elephantulus edwardii TaxID=28737 RepID=UPI0003F0DC13
NEGRGSTVFLLHLHVISEWISRRLSLQDEGIYICYVGTALNSAPNKVVLKVGAFFMPQLKYEREQTSMFLTCCVLTAYPRPTITWHMDNTIISESIIEEMEPLSQFSIKSTLTNTFSNTSYECVIKNSLLQQTWTGRWTMKNQLHKMSRENISLSCPLSNNFSLLNQDFIVTWSKIKNGTSSVLAYFLSSSQNSSISESRFLWNKQLMNQNDFSSTLINLDLSDSAEYLCNISSSKYTSLTVHILDVGTFWG